MTETLRETPPAESQPPVLGPFAFLRHLITSALRPYWIQSALIGLTLIVQVGFYLFLPFAYQVIFDRVIQSGNTRLLMIIGMALAGTFVLATLSDLLQGYLTGVLGTRVTNDFRSKMFNHLHRLSAGFYARAQTGDILSRFANDLNAVDKVVTHSLYQIIGQALLLILSTALLFFFEWRLALITLIALPIAALGPELLGGKATRAAYERKREEARLSNLIQESIQAHKVVRAFGLHQSLMQRFQAKLNILYERSVSANLLSAYVAKSSNLGVLFVQLLAFVIGAYLAIEGYLTVGTLVGFLVLLLNVGDAAYQLTNLFPDVIQATGGYQRIEELLNEPFEVKDVESPLVLPRLSREICFKNVSFSYTGGETNLDEVSFTIPAGKSVGFIGRSGSGKSTVLNLLTRFYDSGQGAIEIDGYDLKQVSQASLRSQIGPVFQDTFLFNTTIRENIRQGQLDATDAAVEEVAQTAEIHDFIIGLPKGYDTMVGEAGGRLSGGQRQRIAIARAILRNPSILVLDEATSALDPGTEAAINATLEKLAQDRTIISVTHRLSSVVNMDCIFVLDEGKLIEQGTHRELLNLKGSYSQIWQEFTLELTQHAVVGDIHAETEDAAQPEIDEDPLNQHIRDLEARVRSEQQEVQRLQAINQRWTQLAGTDALTGLPNKLAVLQALIPQEIQQAQRRAEPVGFILLSGDNFGPINETYGRNAGDQVLRGLSDYLQANIKGEELLGHIDGTHFAVIFHPATLDETRHHAEGLRRQVEEHEFACADTTVRITVSVGIASLHSLAADNPKAIAAEIFQELNGALYKAKRMGGNRVEVAEIVS